MVEEMKLVNIVGLLVKFEECMEKYILNSEIHLENSFSVLPPSAGLLPMMQSNPYEDMQRRFTEVFDYAEIPYADIKRHAGEISLDELDEYINQFDETIHSIKNKIGDINRQLEKMGSFEDTLTPVVNSDVNIDNLVNLRIIKFRFGRMPIDSYNKLDTYLRNLQTYFYVVSQDKDWAWGFYFVVPENSRKIDHIFSSLYFERVRIEGDTEGTPAEIMDRIAKKTKDLSAERTALSTQLSETLRLEDARLKQAYACIKYHYDMHKVKKNASYTRNNFYFVGWMSSDNAEILAEATKGDDNITVIVEDADVLENVKPPTKLKNSFLFKPFEGFVRMYGIPNYNELDPTKFFAIIYVILFGMMFGDLGHGMVMTLAAVLLVSFNKGGFIAKALIPVGISAMFFGILYGTFFGFEGHKAVIHPLWFTPMENSATMNQILMISIGAGVVIILLSMLFNIINGIKQKDMRKIIFSQNGLAGLVFYVAVLYVGMRYVMSAQFDLSIVVVFIAAPLILIFLQEPLSHLTQKSRDRHRTREPHKGFLVEAFFELFEILLSFVTNTISFVRVGAFALNHAGMMSVVLLFMGEVVSAGSITVAIFGNIFVMGLEGLIVGIQVLRLGFYEMFSRFYSGDGREFISINDG